jgi:hypothetical protein
MITIRVFVILMFIQFPVKELYSQLGPLVPVGEFSLVGDMDSLGWSQMTEEEQCMYLACLEECGVNEKTITWITLETIDCLIKTNQFFSCKVVTKYNQNGGEFVIDNPGYYSLPSPQFVVFVTRENGLSMVKLQMYY